MQDVFAPVSRTASATVSKTGTAAVERGLAALARRHAGDDPGAVGLHRAGVEVALAAGDALDDEPRLGSDEDAHAAALPRDAADGLGRRLVQRGGRREVGLPRAGRPPRPRSCPTIRTTIGTSRSWTARASIRPRATSSPRVIPPKMLTRMAFDLRVGQDDPHRRRDLVGPRPAADVEEVGRLAAGPLDEVHRGHRQARAVDHAADRAVELDERQPGLARLAVGRVLLVGVAQLLEPGMAGERGVVEGDLGVEADESLDGGAVRRRSRGRSPAG